MLGFSDEAVTQARAQLGPDPKSAGKGRAAA